LGSHNQQVGEQVDLATVVPATTVPALVAIAIATAAGCCIKAAITKIVSKTYLCFNSIKK